MFEKREHKTRLKIREGSPYGVAVKDIYLWGLNEDLPLNTFLQYCSVVSRNYKGVFSEKIKRSQKTNRFKSSRVVQAAMDWMPNRVAEQQGQKLECVLLFGNGSFLTGIGTWPPRGNYREGFGFESGRLYRRRVQDTEEMSRWLWWGYGKRSGNLARAELLNCERCRP